MLVSLGVAAGDFIQANLKYLDYLVVAVFALAIAYLVYKRVKDVRRHRRERVTDRSAADEIDPAR